MFDFILELQAEEEQGLLDLHHETRGMHDAHIGGDLAPAFATPTPVRVRL